MSPLVSRLSSLLIIVAILAVWQFVVASGFVSPLILPTPTRMFAALIEMLKDSQTYVDTAVTLYEAITGFVIAVLVGVALGVLLAKFPGLQKALEPIIVAVQVTPKVVLAPLFILWFGFGPGSKIVISAVLAFLPIMSNTLLGVVSIERGHRDVMRSLEASDLQRLLFLDLPSSMPAILTGMEVGAIFAMIGTVIGEFMSGSSGLGHVAMVKLNSFEVDGLFASVLLLSLISAAFYAAVVALRRTLTPWHAGSNMSIP